MSLEQPDLYEQMDDLPYQSLKIQNQNTTICVKHKNNTQPSLFDFETIIQTSTDCSFQQGIHQENMDILGNAAAKYLEESLTVNFAKTEGFKDVSLYENLPFEMGGQSELEMLTVRNELFSQLEQEQLMKILKEEEELVGLIRQAAPVFGITVGKELVYAIFQLLRLKLDGYKALITSKTDILPKFSCFQGFQDEQFAYNSACDIYEDINLEEVSLYAEKDLEELCSTLYFSYQIKYLNLREVKPDTKGNVLQRFNTLMRQISRTVFYTISGAVQPSSLSGNSLFALDFTKEISFSEFSQGTILQIHRSMSRPFVPCEEQPQLDFLSKRLKFE